MWCSESHAVQSMSASRVAGAPPVGRVPLSLLGGGLPIVFAQIVSKQTFTPSHSLASQTLWTCSGKAAAA